MGKVVQILSPNKQLPLMKYRSNVPLLLVKPEHIAFHSTPTMALKNAVLQEACCGHIFLVKSNLMYGKKFIRCWGIASGNQPGQKFHSTFIRQHIS